MPSSMDLTGKLGDPARVDASLSTLARGVVGSEILRIAAEIRARKAQGADICNLTVGDFDPAQFRPCRSSARLLLINSPLNPTGTVIDPEVLRHICELVVEENRRREKAGGDARKALWLCYDQVYWQLTFGSARHATPPEVCA